ncbi:MAG: hypothetical protein LPK02_07565 [Rhodobacterales bacterium]|nr:hypothetical protein [Rhodobacterales bacterium]
MALKQVEDNYNARKRASLGVPKTSRNWNHNKFLESLYGKKVVVCTVGDNDGYFEGELICHDSFTLLIKIADGREVLVGKGAGVSIMEHRE